MSDNSLLQKAQYQLESFLSDCQISEFRGQKILEIGFKNGLFLNECHKAGLIPTGIEIEKGYYEKVKTAYPHLSVVWYNGERIPFPNETFDFVVSYQVLEHVSCIEHIFSECVRLLKPNGTMYHVCPNYSSFYEGHYKVIWTPCFNKTLGRYYLKLLRLYTPYYETLSIVKPKTILQSLNSHKNGITLISLGQKEFIRKFNRKQIQKIDNMLLKKILLLLLKKKMLSEILLKLIARINWYYPLTIIARKK